MYINKANFFWHGKSLSLYEYICISSFIKKGFNVNVYSYNQLILPKGAVLCDASEIMPITDTYKYTQGGKSSNLAAFSDAFRYNLINIKGGWWFDADVICLADPLIYQDLIETKEIKISMGYESSDIINGAVLYIDNEKCINKIIEELECAGDVFAWGEIGPKLITRVINNLQLSHLVDPSFYYYAIYEDYH